MKNIRIIPVLLVCVATFAVGSVKLGAGPTTAPQMLALAPPPKPVVYFSDLQSGPNTGGENNGGVFVTIYGNNFGPAQASSTVTVGGARVGGYKLWTNTRIAFQLGPSAVSGNIVVTTVGGISNGVPFRVRTGAIRFVATRGDDAHAGSFEAPWRTIQHAVETVAAGTTIYVMDGVTEANPGTSTGSVTIYTSGASGRPNALIAYPGATATIGARAIGTCDTTDCVEGLGTVDPYPQSWWVIAGLRLRGNNFAIGTVGTATNWRVVGNDISCPYGDGASACVIFSETSNIALYGNNVHDIGWSGASAEYHGVYFSTDSNHLNVGWNVIANVQGCRGLQVHSSPLFGGGPDDPTGRNQYDIVIHDNRIHDTTCDGMVISTVDPSLGKVQIHHNVLYRVGKGPLPPDGGGNFSGIYVTGETNAGAPGGGTVDIYNNTIYDAGAYAPPNSSPGSSNAIENGGFNVNLITRLRNNIIYQLPGEYYTFDWGNDYLPDYPPTSQYFSGSNNLFYGGTLPAPSWLLNNVVADPLFVNKDAGDFRLQSNSPAIGSGINRVDLGALPVK